MGTLGQKLDYLTDTKSILKQKINNLGGSLTDESTFRSYGNYLDELYNEMPKVTGEGTEITLTPTRKGKMQLDLKGNTEQASYTGKNFFNPTETWSSFNGTNCTINNQIVKWSGTTTRGASKKIANTNIHSGTYTITLETINGSHTSGKKIWIDFYNVDTKIESGNWSSDGSITKTFNTDVTRINLGFDNEDTFNNYEFRLQIEAGTQATSYEPYVGGQPLPNPDYPQDIHVVTGENTIGVQGKNLANLSILDNVPSINNGNLVYYKGGACTDYIEINNAKDYYFSYKLIRPTNKYIVFYDENKTFIGYNTIDNFYNLNNFYNYSKTKYVRVRVDVLSYIKYVQLEQGSTATSYVPYYHADYPINLGSIELYKIGNYQDYIYKDSDKWYLHKETHKHTLTGVENWSTGYGEGLFNCGYESFMPTKKAYSPIAYSNYFVFDNREYGMSSLEDNKFAIQGNYTGLFLRNNSITSASDFKTWLSTHNTNIYYVLAEATNTEITDETLISQLDAIENAMSTTGTTTITQTNADLPFIINATALKQVSSSTKKINQNGIVDATDYENVNVDAGLSN